MKSGKGGVKPSSSEIVEEGDPVLMNSLKEKLQAMLNRYIPDNLIIPDSNTLPAMVKKHAHPTVSDIPSQTHRESEETPHSESTPRRNRWFD